MGRVVIDPEADRDIDQHFAYLAQSSMDLAARFLDAVRWTSRRLLDMPGMGRLREFTRPDLAGMRSCAVHGFPNHLIFYQRVKGGIRIRRILHGARDIDAIFDR